MRVWPGAPSPLGATWDGSGVNFAVFSEHASAVTLCLFDSPDATVERHAIPLPECTHGVWHGYLPDAKPGQIYGFRAEGPWEPAQGFRFNPHKVLLDPYAKLLGRSVRWDRSLFAFEAGSEGDGPRDKSDSAPFAALGAVADPQDDWGRDVAPQIPWHETVIYEAHVKGLTALHPEVPPEWRGTYLGLASEPAIRHLKRLGVTAVELMPIHQHADEWPLAERGVTNYWGYNTLAYFVPDVRFASTRTGAGAVSEFKTMVRGLHAAGLEVILDVVYNHTAEGDHRGPTLSFRGLDNSSYYRLLAGRPSRYDDFTGCGNTLDFNTPRVLQLVMDSLRYWVLDMHVDGFRFDLASALARERREFDPRSAFFQAVAQDPVLSRVKLIAEPWDLGEDGYRVGGFPPGWSEWNGRYRDTVRRFWRGDSGVLPELATRLSGSSDLYGGATRLPDASINFVTSHDGFTLADLTVYNEKHNEENGEDNRDGDSNNLSWNGGVEGPTTDALVLEIRHRQQRNFLVTLITSIGVPMISGGDEVGRSQGGNNNAYCQDGPLAWTTWQRSSSGAALLDFTQRLLAFRATQPVLRRRRFLRGRRPGISDVLWLRPDGLEMRDADWSDPTRHAIGVLFDGNAIDDRDGVGRRLSGDTVLILLNAGQRPVSFVPPIRARAGLWECRIDTSDPDRPPLRAPGAVAWTLPEHSAAVFVWKDAGGDTPISDVQWQIGDLKGDW